MKGDEKREGDDEGGKEQEQERGKKDGPGPV